jgi:hypothetical protein
MKIRAHAFAIAGWLFASLGSFTAAAGPGDYSFEAVQVEVRSGPDSELAVRLIHKPTGKAVSGAIIFRSRLDMSPDEMGSMTAKHEPLPETEPGVYRFKADLTMAGRWAFKMMAKVQGETATIEGSVIFAAKE